MTFQTLYPILLNWQFYPLTVIFILIKILNISTAEKYVHKNLLKALENVGDYKEDLSVVSWAKTRGKMSYMPRIFFIQSHLFLSRVNLYPL